MKLYRLFILFFLCISIGRNVFSQNEKIQPVNTSLLSPSKSKDTSLTKKAFSDTSIIKKDTIPKHDPRIATRRSAIIPGWGQAYNKEYWKIPLVYGALAIPAALYFYNDSYYDKTKFAYEARYKEAHGDPGDVQYIDPELKNLSASSLQNYRNSFRRNRDLSIFWFLITWGLQVVDATVFAHLKQFDVSNDLTMNVTPVFNPATRTPGVGLTVSLKNTPRKPVISR